MKLALFLFVFFQLSVGLTKSNALSQPEASPFLQNGKNYLRAAYSAYCKTDAIRSRKCYWCLREDVSNQPFYQATHFFNGGGRNSTFGWAGYSDSEIIFSFRGTVPSEFHNWVTNIGVFMRVPFKAEIPRARVHSGFLAAYTLVADSVIKAAIELSARFPGRKVIITGHSLGGALATLAAADISVHPKTSDDVRLWTFGSPRVGNAGFVEWMNTKYLQSYRLVNNRDIVPSLPGRAVGYLHVNHEYFFTSASFYKVCNNVTYTTEDQSCSDRYRVRTSISDHVRYMGINLNDGDSKGC